MKISKQQLKEIIREELVSLNEQLTDLQFIINQISFDMRRYSNEKKFVEHLSKETSYDVNKLKNVFKAYQKLSNTEKYKMETPYSGAVLAKKFLAKHGIVREELETLNEDQYGDVSFSRRKLKLASEDAECILHCLADKSENEELPNWWIDKVSKAADYLNVCRDYIKTDDINGIHEDTEKEFPIWGIPPGKTSEELLYTKATSHSQAKKIAKVLTDKHGCKKVRIQVLDLAQNPADIFKSDKIFNK